MTCTINASPTNGLQMTSDGSGVLQLQSNGVALGITSMTAQNTTSGTLIDFTGIPAGVKRITMMFNEVSTSGTSLKLVQIGSGSIVTTGYLASSSAIATSVATTSSTAGFVFNSNIATDVISGQVVLTNVSGNIWVASYAVKESTTATLVGGGSVTLSGTLDRVRLTTVNGTDTFDAGSVNVLYEVW